MAKQGKQVFNDISGLVMKGTFKLYRELHSVLIRETPKKLNFKSKVHLLEKLGTHRQSTVWKGVIEETPRDPKEKQAQKLEKLVRN